MKATQSRQRKNARRFLVIGLVLAGLTAAICVPVTYEYRRLQRNDELLNSIMHLDADRAVSLLRQGAVVDMRLGETSSATVSRALRNVFARSIQRSSRSDASSISDPRVLMLYYSCAMKAVAVRKTGEQPAAEKLPLALLDRSAVSVGTADGDYCMYGAASLHHHAVLDRLLGSRSLGGDGSVAATNAVFAANPDDLTLLINHGANLGLRDDAGNTPLFQADTLKAVTLLNGGANIEARNSLGQTPLIAECVAGNDDAVMVLLARRASAAAHDANGTTPLLAAAAHCKLETIKALRHAGSDLRAVKKDGTTALMYSILNPDERVFNWFLKSGADLTARGMGNNTALTLAIQQRDQAVAAGLPAKRYDSVVNVLKKLGAKSSE